MAGNVDFWDLNGSDHDEHCEKFLESKKTKSSSTGKLFQLEEKHFTQSDIISPISPQKSSKSCYSASFRVKGRRWPESTP